MRVFGNKADEIVRFLREQIKADEIQFEADEIFKRRFYRERVITKREQVLEKREETLQRSLDKFRGQKNRHRCVDWAGLEPG